MDSIRNGIETLAPRIEIRRWGAAPILVMESDRKSTQANHAQFPNGLSHHPPIHGHIAGRYWIRRGITMLNVDSVWGWERVHSQRSDGRALGRSVGPDNDISVDHARGGNCNYSRATSGTDHCGRHRDRTVSNGLGPLMRPARPLRHSRSVSVRSIAQTENTENRHER
jgi:hypothetical protein